MRNDRSRETGSPQFCAERRSLGTILDRPYPNPVKMPLTAPTGDRAVVALGFELFHHPLRVFELGEPPHLDRPPGHRRRLFVGDFDLRLLFERRRRLLYPLLKWLLDRLFSGLLSRLGGL